MADQFKPGDVVELKGGGPDMTISSVDDDSAYCEWFDAKNAPQGRRYQFAVLKHSES